MNIRNIFHDKRTAAAAILPAALFLLTVIAVAVVLIVNAGHDTLVLRDAETGYVYERFDCPNGTRFEIDFIHSVNRSPVIDVFEARDGTIYAVETRYYSFGAGMPTEADQPTWKFSYSEDGAIVVTGITYSYDSLNYIVGTVFDHYLTINGKRINLRELCGKNTKLEIYQQK